MNRARATQPCQVSGNPHPQPYRFARNQYGLVSTLQHPLWVGSRDSAGSLGFSPVSDAPVAAIVRYRPKADLWSSGDRLVMPTRRLSAIFARVFAIGFLPMFVLMQYGQRNWGFDNPGTWYTIYGAVVLATALAFLAVGAVVAVRLGRCAGNDR